MIGTSIGVYRITAKLGAGGMGEVYRATDTKLKRDVALKVLPEAFARDPERLARFEREAEVLASLNHPNIAQIYGVVEDRALVMELVEGSEPKGPLPFDEAWAIASQIAAALEYAHEKGVVHRDLKPANIKVTPDGKVKLLDFGLAKAFSGQADAQASPENSPTLTIGATQAGVILGTAAYMSPEQAKGKRVDKRADIWAFGVVELLTGERLFKGEDVSETLAQVLTKEPDLNKVPAKARRLLCRCLEKDPKKRLRDIGDAAPLLEESAQAPNSPRRIGAVSWGLAGLFLCTTIFVSLIHFRQTPPTGQITRFQIAAPENVTIGSSGGHVLSMSPDGRRLVFVGRSADGQSSLWLRSLESLDTRSLPGTEDATAAIWSPDSRYLAFGVPGKLKKIDLSGGPPITLCNLSSNLYGGSWNREGIIIYSIGSSNLWQVSQAGGIPSKLTELNASRGESYHAPPVFLPDGRHFIYFRYSQDQNSRGVYVGELGKQSDQQDSKRLLDTNFSADYAPSVDPSVGRLLYLREQTLFAQAFDNRRFALTGEAVPIAEGLGTNGPNGWLSASSRALTYRFASAAGSEQLSWFQADGSRMPIAPGRFPDAALSPDGTRAAVALAYQGDEFDLDLWILDLLKSLKTRFTFSKSGDTNPVWSPDGNRIAFSSRRREGKFDLYVKPSNGASTEELLLSSDRDKIALDWSHDGEYLLYQVSDPKTKWDLWYLPMKGADKQPVRFLATEFNETQGRFSPDRRLVAYQSDESGVSEIYVRTFPEPSGRWQVSKNRGSRPRWRKDGKALYYVEPDGTLMSVDITMRPEFQSGTPKKVLNGMRTFFDVSADGKRFLVQDSSGEGSATPIMVVLDWQASLKR